MKSPSQCDRILAALSDGKPHDMLELHQQVGFCRMNSRVAELRKRGHVITCDRTGGHYIYRLIASGEEPKTPRLSAGTASVSLLQPASSPVDIRQRSLFEDVA